MRTFMTLTLIIFVIGAWRTLLLLVHAECGRCQRNGVACVGHNEFYICAGDRPLNGVKFVCPWPNDVCTNATIVCDVEERYGVSCDNRCDAIDFITEQNAFCAQQANTGFFEDMDYVSCNTFILCYVERNGELKGVRKRCPDTMLYSNLTHICHVRELFAADSTLPTAANQA